MASKQEIQDADSLLSKVFYSKEHNMASFPRLWHRIKNGGKSPIPYRVVKAWYDNQEIVQLFRPLQKPQTVYHIKTTKPLAVVYMDTMIIGNLYIINTIDLFSKFASSCVFKKAVTSADAVKSLKKFLTSLDALRSAERTETKSDLTDIGEVRCDGGPEFLSSFQDFVGTKRVVSLAYRKSEMSPVERFNRTLRLFLERMIEYHGKPIDWGSRYIPQAIEAYNTTIHSSTGYTPKEAFLSKEAQSIIRRAQIQISPATDIRAGDTVRITTRDVSNIFDKKIRSNWSRETYVVKSVSRTRVTLDDGQVWKDYEVLKIDPDLLMTHKPKHPINRETPAERKSRRERQRELKDIADYLTAPPKDNNILPEKRSRNVTKRMGID